MGAKYVELLLLYADDIRNSLVSVADSLAYVDTIDDNSDFGYGQNKEPYVNISFDSSAYDDLMTVLEKIKYLHDRGVISDRQLQILNLVSENISYQDIAVILGMARRLVSKSFKETCEVVAYYLGEYFTDEGFVEYIVNKYSLNENQIEQVQKYIYDLREE